MTLAPPAGFHRILWQKNTVLSVHMRSAIIILLTLLILMGWIFGNLITWVMLSIELRIKKKMPFILLRRMQMVNGNGQERRLVLNMVNFQMKMILL